MNLAPIHRIKQSKFISIIQDEIHKLIDISKQVHVHRSLLIFLSNQLRNYSSFLEQQKFNDHQIDESEQKQFEKIISIIQNLQEIFKSQYEVNWYNYLMKYPVTHIFDELDRYIENLNKISLKLQLFYKPPIEWSEEQTKNENLNDLGVIQHLFQDKMASTDTEKLSEIISLKNAIKSGSNVIKKNRTKFLSTKTIQATLLPFEQYEIDLNDIELQKKIGSGGFSDVHLGYMKTDGTIVAVKQLHQQKFDEYSLEMFQREVRTLSELNHFAILPFVGAHMTPPYSIVTEYMNGGSLFSRIHPKDPSEKLTPTKLTIIALGIAYGMSYLHSQQMIHRDLKSLNILLDANDYPKISDFGLSRTKINDTMTGRIGTCQWMAPEVLSSQKYDEKADVYSYGIILWEMLTGDIPYRGLTDVQIAVQVCKNHNRPKIPRNCPQNLAKFIKVCWSDDQDKRPDFSTIAKALEDGAILFPGTNVTALKDYVKQFSSVQKQPNMQVNIATLPPVDIDPYYVTADDVNGYINDLQHDEQVILILATIASNQDVKEIIFHSKNFIPYLVFHLKNSNSSMTISFILLLLTHVLPDENMMKLFLENEGHEALLGIIPKTCSILIPRLLDCLIAIIEATPLVFHDIHIAKLSPYLICTDITQRQLAIYLFNQIIDLKYYKSTRIFTVLIENLLKNTILEAKEDLLTSSLALLLKISAFHKTKEEFKFCFASDKICIILKHSSIPVLHLSLLLLQVLFSRYDQNNSTIQSFLTSFSSAMRIIDNDGKLAGLNALSLIMNNDITYSIVSSDKNIMADLNDCANANDQMIQIASLRLCYAFCINKISVESFTKLTPTFLSLLNFDKNEQNEQSNSNEIENLEDEDENTKTKNKVKSKNRSKSKKLTQLDFTILTFASFCLSAIFAAFDPLEIIGDETDQVLFFIKRGLKSPDSELALPALRILGILAGKMSGAMLVEHWNIFDKIIPFLKCEETETENRKKCMNLTISFLAALSSTIPYCSLLSISIDVLFNRCMLSIEKDKQKQNEYNDNDNKDKITDDSISNQNESFSVPDSPTEKAETVKTDSDNDESKFDLLPFVCISNMTVDPDNAHLCVRYLSTLLDFAGCDINEQKVERSLVTIHHIITTKEGKNVFKSSQKYTKKFIKIVNNYHRGRIAILLSSIIDELIRDQEICVLLKKFGLAEFISNEIDQLASKTCNRKIVYVRILSRLQSVQNL